MMTDEELAGKIIELGVGVYLVADETYLVDDNSLEELGIDEFLDSWAIAGLLMEKFNYYMLYQALDEIGVPPTRQEEKLAFVKPRPIIEACVGVLLEASK